MKKKIITELTKKNVKTYLFFLIFTSFLWFALQFSKNYSKEINFNIEYTKVSKDQFVQANSDQEVSLILEGNGFQLLKFFVFNKKINLDVRKAVAKNSKKSYFTGSKMMSVIKESLGYTGKVAFSSKDTIVVNFSKIITKEIPVKIKQDIEYENGFISSKGITLSKKTIKITGPEVILDTLTTIETEIVVLKKLQKSFKGNIGLNLENLSEDLIVSQSKIPISIEVDKITEGEFKIPIKILNLDENQTVQLFPKEVSVIFGVALKDYPKLKAEDFSIAVDIKKATPQSNTLSLKLVKNSGLVYNVRLSENEVQFIVIK